MVDTKGLIFFISGLVIGAAGGGYLVFRYTKSYYEKENEAAALERAEYYHNKYNDIPVKEVKDDEKVSEEKGNDKVKAEEEKESYEGMAGIYKPDESNRVITDYHSISSGDSSSDSRPSTKKKGKKKKPYIISEEIFNENVQDYDKVFVSYYEVDNVFINDETDEQPDLMDEIGSNNLYEADDELFVANDQTKTMYSVTIEHKAWSEEGL